MKKNVNPDQCYNCLKEHIPLVRAILSNGAIRVCRHCYDCDHNGDAISHELLLKNGIDINSLPLLYDRREHICACCGRLGADDHHIIPGTVGKIIELEYSDPVSRVTIPLCQECHAKVHDHFRKFYRIVGAL